MDGLCHGISRGFAPISAAVFAKEATMKHLSMTLAAMMLMLALPASAQGAVPINEEPVINDTLLQGFIGDAIADNCPTMEPRKLRALGELNKLKNYALGKGYSTAEVRAFVTDKKEKARGKALAADWLRERGAEPGNADAYCKIGEEEIAKESLIGYLLRSTK
jgi:hypothetical protein